MSKHTESILAAHASGYRVDARGSVFDPRGKKVALAKTGDGYLKFTLRTSSIRSATARVHKFAAYQWFGLRALEPKVHVRHLNGDSFDNRRRNLGIGSAADNHHDKPYHVRQRVAMLGAMKRRRLTGEQAREIVRLAADGWTGKALAERFGVWKSTISQILSGYVYASETGVIGNKSAALP